MSDARTILRTCTLQNLPDLDVAVLGALDLFAETPPRQVIPVKWDRILVVGSGNARSTGEILFRDMDAVYADESTIDAALIRHTDIGGALIISASGGKHAVPIAQKLKARHIPAILLTNNPTPRAGEFVAGGHIVVFPKNREPYTYNTSTYLGMILSETKEDAGVIREFVTSTVSPLLTQDFTKWNAYVLIVPARFAALTAMIRTKFDELFGPFVTGRVFTEEEIKHAKTVSTSPRECFITCGVTNEWYGVKENRIHIPLPETADYGAAMAVAYYVVGQIQKQLPPYFKNNIAEYTSHMSEIFGEPIRPIVE
jgi:hypothetical protein